MAGIVAASFSKTGKLGFVAAITPTNPRLPPKGYLTGADWNSPKIYVDYVNWIREGKPWPNLLRGA